MMDIIRMDKEQKAEFMRNLMSWSSQKLAIESNKRVEEYIKTGEGRHFVEAYLLGQILLLRNGQSSFFKDFDRFKGDFLELMQISAPSMLQNYFFNGKIFTLTTPVYNLLENTSNKIFLRKHPFHVFAIDQKIKTKYNGLNIIFIIFFSVSTDFENINGCNYLVLGRDERDNSEFWLTGDLSTSLKECKVTKFFPKEEGIEIIKKTREMYANFLDYLNHPYAKQIVYKAPDNTLNRIRRGKFPRQDKIVIDIKPEFIYNQNTGEKQSRNSYSHSFWVRGHFKHFRNKKRYNKIYSLTKEVLERRELFYNGEYLSKWIVPYIKGIGKLKEKIRRTT